MSMGALEISQPLFLKKVNESEFKVFFHEAGKKNKLQSIAKKINDTLVSFFSAAASKKITLG